MLQRYDRARNAPSGSFPPDEWTRRRAGRFVGFLTKAGDALCDPHYGRGFLRLGPTPILRSGEFRVRILFRSIACAAIFAFGIAAALVAQSPTPAVVPTVVVDKVMPAPAWAYAEQTLLRANADLVQAYAATHFDEKWHNKAPEEWGVGNGPDDIPEALRSWPMA